MSPRPSDHVRSAREAMKAGRFVDALNHLEAAKRLLSLREATKKTKLAMNLVELLIRRIAGKPDREKPL